MKVALDLFKDTKVVQNYEPGDTIFTEGDIGESMYVILNGEVEISQDNRLVDCLLPGDIFGEMALIDDSPRCATAKAHTACRVAPVDRYNFLFLIEHHPMFALEVMGVMAGRLRESNR